MMKEIRARGPIISDFKVPVEFHYYSKGILSDKLSEAIKVQGQKITNKKFINKKSMEDLKFAW